MCQINVGHAVHATDVSNASRTLMMDLGAVKWDEDVLLRAMGVPLCMLPEIRPSSEVLGRIKSEGDKSTGEWCVVLSLERMIGCVDSFSIFAYAFYY
jgi:glycerol kinase